MNILDEMNVQLKEFLEEFWQVEDASTLTEEQIKRAYRIKFASEDLARVDKEIAERKE